MSASASLVEFTYSDGARISITEIAPMATKTKTKPTSPFLKHVKGIPERALRALERAGLETVGDFVRHAKHTGCGLDFMNAARLIAGIVHEDLLPINNAMAGAYATAMNEQQAKDRNGHAGEFVSYGDVKPAAASEAQTLAPPSAAAGGHAPNVDPDEILRVPLKAIVPNPLNPRKSIDQVELENLAKSIMTHGLLTPVLLRPHPNAGALAIVSYELVCGERRFRACGLAGLKVIPATVRNLADRDCREIMHIENVQRADLTPLEEAESYHELTKIGLTVEDLAKRVGKSASTIRNSLKLLKLPDVAREAVKEGRLAPSVAALIARIPGETTRELAAAHILAGTDWWHDKPPKIAKDSEPLTFRAAKELIDENCMIELKQAPFDRKAIDLVPGVPSCHACPKRVGNLQAGDPDGYKGVRADVCTDPDCYREKVQAHQAAIAAEAKAKGSNVLSARQSAELFSHGDNLRYDSAYVKVNDLSATAAATLDDSQITIATDKDGAMHRLVKRTAAPAASNGRHTPARPQKSAKERLDEQVEREATRTQLAELAQKAADHFPIPTRPQNCAMLRHMIGESLGWGAVRDHVLARHDCAGKTTTQKIEVLKKLLGALDAPALFALLVEFVCGPEVAGAPRYHYHRSGAEDLAGVLGLTKRTEVEQRIRARLAESSKKPGTNGKPLTSQTMSTPPPNGSKKSTDAGPTTPAMCLIQPGASLDAANIHGLDFDAVDESNIAGLYGNGKPPKSPVKVRPFALDDRLWVVTGTLHSPNRADCCAVPLYSITDYRAKFGTQPTKLEPRHPTSDEAGGKDRHEFYTGVLVSHGGVTYAIGPASEKRTIFSTKHGNYAMLEKHKRAEKARRA